MPENVEAILARVEDELGERARAVLVEALGVDDDSASGAGGPPSSLPDDVEAAKDGELKATGSNDGGAATPDDAVTEAELEEAIADLRAEAITQDELDQILDEVEGSAEKALMEALPGLIDDVGQKMHGGHGYSGEIASAYGGHDGHRTGLEAGRRPTGSGRGTSQKMGSGDAVDYADEIEAAFGGSGS